MTKGEYWRRIFVGVFTSLTFILFLLGCIQEKKRYLADWNVLSELEFNLLCQLESKKTIMKDKWDQVNETLEKNFDPRMTDQEKQNMIKLRNANLIRMFQSYKNMEIQVGDVVNSAEQMDQKFSQEISQIQIRLDSIMKEKMQIEQWFIDNLEIDDLRKESNWTK